MNCLAAREEYYNCSKVGHSSNQIE